MRWNLNSRAPCALGELKGHLEAERAAYLRINFEKPDVPTTACEREALALYASVVGPEMERAIEAAVALATAQGGSRFHASAMAYAYPTDHPQAGMRSITVSVDQVL